MAPPPTPRPPHPPLAVALPAHTVHGGRLTVCAPDGDVEISAPPEWLELLAEADAEGLLLGELSERASARFGESGFADLVAALTAQGLLGLYPSGAARPRVDFFEDSVSSATSMARAQLRWPEGSHSEGWGRGTSRATAARRALGEAVERHAFKRMVPAVLARGCDIADAEPRRAFVAHTPAQYREPGFPLAAYSRFDERPWLETTCLASGRSRWMPAEAVIAAQALAPIHRDRRCAQATSSGFACAPSLDDATEHALWELVERDAFMRHWMAQRGGVGIDLETLPASTRRPIEELIQVGCTVAVQRLTLGTAPVWLAVVQHPTLRFTFTGAAAGADAEDAVERAVAEAHGQALARVSSGDVPTGKDALPHTASTPGDHARLYSMPAYFRRADALLGCEGSEAFPGSVGRTATGRDVLAQAGLMASFLDFSESSPAFDDAGRRLHTVRVIVPNLVPMTFGAALLPLAFGSARHGAEFPHPFA